MPPLQTVFADRPPEGLKGRRVNAEEWNGITCLPTDNTVGVAVPVQMGTTGPESIVEFTTGRFRGITELDQFAVYDASDNYEAGYNVPVMTSGVIWVIAGAAVVAGDRVFFDTATKTYNNATGVEILGAEFDSNAAADGLVKVRLREAIHVTAGA